MEKKESGIKAAVDAKKASAKNEMPAGKLRLLPGQKPSFSYIVNRNAPAVQKQLYKQHTSYHKAIPGLSNPDVIAPGKNPEKKPYRAAERVAKMHNKKHGTNFKKEDQQKISAGRKNGLVHAHGSLDKPSGTVYSVKPKIRSQERKEAKLKGNMDDIRKGIKARSGQAKQSGIQAAAQSSGKAKSSSNTKSSGQSSSSGNSKKGQSR